MSECFILISPLIFAQRRKAAAVRLNTHFSLITKAAIYQEHTPRITGTPVVCKFCPYFADFTHHTSRQPCQIIIVRCKIWYCNRHTVNLGIGSKFFPIFLFSLYSGLSIVNRFVPHNEISRQYSRIRVNRKMPIIRFFTKTQTVNNLFSQCQRDSFGNSRHRISTIRRLSVYFTQISSD